MPKRSTAKLTVCKVFEPFSFLSMDKNKTICTRTRRINFRAYQLAIPNLSGSNLYSHVNCPILQNLRYAHFSISYPRSDWNTGTKRKPDNVAFALKIIDLATWSWLSRVSTCYMKTVLDVGSKEWVDGFFWFAHQFAHTHYLILIRLHNWRFHFKLFEVTSSLVGSWSDIESADCRLNQQRPVRCELHGITLITKLMARGLMHMSISAYMRFSWS